MSRRAVTTITCDQCAHLHLPETPAISSVVVKFQGDLERQVDLCEEHTAQVEAFRAMVRIRGSRPSPRGGGLVCPICGQICGSSPGLANHTRARHG